MTEFNLPNEIWCKIFLYLPLTPKKNATATCKLWWRLIREDRKLSASISISWYDIFALEKLKWNWNNWPALKILELYTLDSVEDTREAVQKVIEKLSLKDCQSLELVLFDLGFDGPKNKLGQTLLQYLIFTDQIFGLGQKLDSDQKWETYESNMKLMRNIKSMGIKFDPLTVATIL